MDHLVKTYIKITENANVCFICSFKDSSLNPFIFTKVVNVYDLRSYLAKNYLSRSRQR